MKSIFYKWLFILGGLIVAIFTVFFQQVRAVSADWLSSSPPGEATLLDSDLGSIKEVKFVDEGASIAYVTVGELAVISHQGSNALVGISLHSNAPTSTYPSLRIFLKSGTRTVRTLVLGPTEYTHGGSLVTEQVRIPISLLSGESSFTAQAFYADAGDAK
ncbi:MAG: hypothetical protein RXR20_02565 [Paraburkholderia sp.]|jgi:hypothetical protein|uniref:Uncharacterized protein n=1 Tax=Paraburkholderia phytofirmans OLGA172 TaxID=1417228 RepID=A0A161I3I3_9BURK|nr:MULTISPECIES: hypothetical protein [Burkholderiaceae]ANB78010.1 hypothetical protein AYM40_37235 [Paraburkholderia phytofirmans OLGA172]